MIDFTNMPKKRKAYAGANGNKISVIFDDEQYMLKFPPVPSINQEMSYSNSCISEYLGCHIFESVGIPVQKTLLGKYNVGGKEKIVVACKDFTSIGVVLQDFASIKNQIIDSVRNGYGTELDDIMETITSQGAVDKVELLNRFWDMFIVDALIGNWDRHNGNWGFLYDTAADTLQLAPVYDCGSSLYPQADDKLIGAILANKKEQDYRVFEIPMSAIKMDGKKIKYYHFISSLSNADCNAALKRIVPRIDMEKIDQIVEGTPIISDLQKEFYKTMLHKRKELILEHSLELLQQRECKVKTIAVKKISRRGEER